MKSLAERKNDRKERAAQVGPMVITDENTKFIHADALPELLAHAAQIDVNVAGENAERAELAEAQQLLTQHSKKAADKAAKREKSASDDVSKGSVTEVKKQGAQPSDDVTKKLVGVDSTGNGGGAGWKAN